MASSLQTCSFHTRLSSRSIVLTPRCVCRVTIIRTREALDHATSNGWSFAKKKKGNIERGKTTAANYCFCESRRLTRHRGCSRLTSRQFFLHKRVKSVGASVTKSAHVVDQYSGKLRLLRLERRILRNLDTGDNPSAQLIGFFARVSSFFVNPTLRRRRESPCNSSPTSLEANNTRAPLSSVCSARNRTRRC